MRQRELYDSVRLSEILEEKIGILYALGALLVFPMAFGLGIPN